MLRVLGGNGVAFAGKALRRSSVQRAAVSTATQSAPQHDPVTNTHITPESISQPSTQPVAKSSTWPPSSAFALYNTSIPPSAAQLAYANRFFLASKPTFLTGSAKFRALPVSSVPEVAFLGRSNVGKSSLLNALLHRSGMKLANVSKKPGRTKQMNAFGLCGTHWVGGETREDGTKASDRWEGRGGMVILDMPGYGKASRQDWGKEITKYLVGRRQLRRAFVLIDGEYGVKKSDVQLLDVLRGEGIMHQVVLSKIDKLLFPRGKVTMEILERNLDKMRDLLQETREGITPGDRRGTRPLDDILTCSAEKDLPPATGRKLGIDNLRWAVLSAAGMDCDVDGAVKKFQYDIEEVDQNGDWSPIATA